MRSLPVLYAEGGLSRYLDQINIFPILSLEEEISLSNKWINYQDLESAHTLVTSHLKLVTKVALKFKNYGLPLSDLISEGNIGLMKAVKKFTPEFNCRLSTYAMYWIKAGIQDYVLKSWSMVKGSASAAQKKLFFNLKKVKNRIQQLHNGQSYNHNELIANELGVSESEVQNMDCKVF